ncbi:MAG: TetR/AcrR family transcriptional regulator [Cyanobacteria bacterium P01_A01_bin.84]
MTRAKANDKELEISSEKAQQILKGAMQVFLARGYAGASMDKVAIAAGVSKATVYSYFQDKEGLFTALVQKLTRERFQSVFGDEPLQGEPKIVLSHLLSKGLDDMIKDVEYRAFKRMVIGESGRFPKLAQACVTYMIKPVVETISQYLASHPELNLPDPEATSRIIMGALVHYIMVQEMLHGSEILPMEKERLINGLMYLILRGEEKKVD